MADADTSTARFEISFRATLTGVERMEASSQLVEALHRVPGAGRPQGSPDVHTDHVAASFDLDLDSDAGFADAAVAGTRIARDGLDAAGLGASRLIELLVRAA